MKLLVLDNYDSFTYNLVHLVKTLGVTEVDVRRNDQITLGEAGAYESILLSPGPGIPLEAGIMPDVVRTYGASRKILGVCLGHQCIGEIYGGTLVNMGSPVHGKGVETKVIDKRDPLFRGLPESFITGRYHSWLVSSKGFPSCLSITAVDSKGDIMALRHTEYRVWGVQFHPESVLTQHGAELMKNWLRA